MATARTTTTVALAGALALAGCGSRNAARSAPSLARPAFGQIRPASAPGGWHAARISSGAVLAYPPGWSRASSDPGTASAILAGDRQRIVGYLNVTPRQGGETLANWSEFRVRHNVEEGDRAVTTEASAYRVRFLMGTGSCVRDSYTTVSRARYVEIACLVTGTRATSVIVAAATRADWAGLSRVLYRALSAFRT
jgi:hypothetical protein